ncbi:hypothetical protein [Streptomyces sp. V4I2]|uniref:hypothetical protein n=1 Tax=Streptomyces sp. V4I2 TaxID=3042280 RepID=UPI00278843D3|nr:hypothetical protein [Streptomyces sp. V4I2]MDQ1046817.1 hypothetical protein [Streptomyces sp. V4I2]
MPVAALRSPAERTAERPAARAADLRVSRRGPALRERVAATVPRTTMPVTATAAAIGPPAREAAATAPTVLFAPDKASGTMGQPPGVWSTCFTSWPAVGGVSVGGDGWFGAAGRATGSVLRSVML